jgi:threonine synthase
LAAAIKLIESGKIPRDESLVVCITGNGLKTLEAVADRLPLPEAIPASIDAFDRHLAEREPAAAAV